MFGISGEHLLVLLVILLIFGPRRLPDLGHSIGRTLKNFKDAMAGDQPTSSPSSHQVERKAAETAQTTETKEAQPEKV